MRGQIFSNIENTTKEATVFVNQNDYTLLVNLTADQTVYAMQGSMVAFKGAIDFDYKGAGIKRMVKSIATGEGMSLMKITGTGDVYLAHAAHQVHVVELENDQITIASRYVLAFTGGVDWDIDVIKAGVMGFAAGGLFNTTLKGSGSVALITDGTPIVIPVAGDGVHADINSVIAWSTNLQVSIRSSFKMKSLIGRGSGESFQMGFAGNGYIVVQPSEGVVATA